MRLLATLALLLGALAPATASQEDAPEREPIRVVCTVPAYTSLVSEIGADLVDITTICRPGQDLHNVMATPAFMARVRGAELLFYTGLDAELWLDGLLRGAGAVKLLPGNRDAVIMSAKAPLKEVPVQLDRSQGDLHMFGNPHVWTDPLIVRDMADIVADALVRWRPDQEDAIRERAAAFKLRLTKALVRWLTDYAELSGTKVVTFHQSWRYLLDRFGMIRVGTLEPKPRVTPTTGHLNKLVETMEQHEVRLVIKEPWQPPQATDFVAERTGATVVDISTQPGWPEGTEDIVAHFDHNLALLAEAVGIDASEPED